MISLQGNASDAGTQAVVIASKKLPSTKLAGEKPGLDLAALHTPAFQYNVNATARKISPLNNCIYPVLFTGSYIVVSEKKQLPAFCELPQSIALKLLFPRHYFW